MLGLAPVNKENLKDYNFLENLKYQGLISQKIFSIYLGKGDNKKKSHI